MNTDYNITDICIVGWGFAGILLGHSNHPCHETNSRYSPLFGLQQFAEFMTCTANAFVWAALGFSVYSFIPALGLTQSYPDGEPQMKILYIIPIIAMLFAILYPSFIEGTYCGTYIVSEELLTGIIQR